MATQYSKREQTTSRVINGVEISKDNIIIDGRIPVKKRHYYGSARKNITCIDENGRFINVEMFSPVIYDLEDAPPKYNPKWETYVGKGKEKTLARIDYPESYKRWWYKHRNRCLNGYTVGGVTISGPFYWYLNFWRIQSKKKGEGLIPPRFLDLDKQFFDYVEQAKAENKHLMVLKRRQIGFSEKCAALIAYDYTFFPKAHCMIIGGESKYSLGTMAKVVTGLNALSGSTANAGREFYKSRLVDTTEMIKSGYMSNGVDTGYESVTEAITVKDNPGAVVGRSATIALMEEVGANGVLKATTGQLKPAMEERGMLDGRIIIFVGTGGTMERGIMQYKDMFYNPEKNGLLAVDNVWDEHKKGQKCCPFFPAWLYYIQDEDGNSYEDLSMLDIMNRRKALQEDKEGLFGEIVAMPLTPEEAFNSQTDSLFNKQKLQAQYEYLSANKADELEQWGRFDWIKDDKGKVLGVEWTPAGHNRFEKDADGDEKFPACITEQPYGVKEFKRLLTDTRISDLYGGGTDSYDKDKAATSDSKGACSIYKSFLDAHTTSNCHVARMLWRPSIKEKFFAQTAMMMVYYHSCKNLIEWSNITIFQWYKSNGWEHLLRLRPQFISATIKHSQVDNKYGIDPNSKSHWEDLYSDYINQYSQCIQTMEACERYIAYRRNKPGDRYNCDLTIADMLAYLCLYRFGQIIDRKKNENKRTVPMIGYVSVNGVIQKL